MFRRAAVFVDHILKGEDHPATFPVEQPTAFELVVKAQMKRPKLNTWAEPYPIDCRTKCLTALQNSVVAVKMGALFVRTRIAAHSGRRAAISSAAANAMRRSYHALIKCQRS
jgi:hypothetical protein